MTMWCEWSSACIDLTLQLTSGFQVFKFMVAATPDGVSSFLSRTGCGHLLSNSKSYQILPHDRHDPAASMTNHPESSMKKRATMTDGAALGYI